ncbi:hypothetical protein MKK68_19970 [Methylobacterium sp. E-016]|uniref:hypothetical protein n=1 Tax=Methylobacterium sp. E-016 TaxID=2836556 RepID=UPI001FBBA3ED|nr:hypothetical protein [Methylobacterium sp. E-016]MCJ2077892.1 hypothetical protein [Methylobacterium sp. E-016]
MFDAITFPDRLTAAVPTELAEAVRLTAAARGLTVADYVRGSVQARLMLDGARFRPLPNLQRHAARPGRVRTL